MRFVKKGLIVVLLAAVVGCGKSGEPQQPTMTDEQVKELMKQGAQRREWSSPRPPTQ